MTEQAVRFSAVVATAGRPGPLERALVSLLEAEPAPWEILVVDGDATRSAEPVVRALDGGRGQIRYVSSERGLTRQRNRALQECRGDVVAFFDDDARVAPDVFALLGRTYEDPGVVGATGLVIEPASNRVGGKESRVRRFLPGSRQEGRFARYGYPNRLVHTDVAREIEFMQGCFMTARLETARVVGFDEHFSGYSLLEDEDFSFRLSRLGRIRYEPAAVVHHDNLGFGTRDTRAFGHQVVANRTYLFEKNFSPTALTWVQYCGLLGILLVHRLLNRDLQGARGLLEGIARLPSRPRPRPAGETALPRVVFVSSHAQLGGSERYLLRLLHRLGEVAPTAVAGVVLLQDGPFEAELRDAGLEPVVFHTTGSKISILTGTWALRRWVRDRPVSVLHANGVKAALACVLAATGPGMPPVVWVKHDFSWDGRLANLIASRCRDVVGVSRAVVAGLRTRRVHVVPPGIDLPAVDRASARRRMREAAGGHGPFVLLLGRLHPVKGHDELLAIVPDLAIRHPGLRVVFAGGDDPHHLPYASGIRQRAGAPERRDHVALLGHVHDPAELLAGADVVVVPSVEDERGMGREGFGLAALEAMAVGTPVVAYADGAVPEVVGPCGILVPPGDRSALAAAILDVLADEDERARLARCGESRVRDRFTTERWAGEMLDRYRHAAQR